MVRYGTIQTHNLASRERILRHLARNGQFGWVVEFSFANWDGAGSNLSSVTSTSVMALLQAMRSLSFRLLKILSIQVCKQICSFEALFSLHFFSYFRCHESPKLSIQYHTVHAKRNPEFVVQILDNCATHYWLRDLFHQWITKPIYQWPSANKKKHHLF